ncbi:hypothetical protein X928_01975 [Petrotoga miotherma DSM 10691]|uniref:Uncharacterized protein n=1 Tax=Petrotoga miotherma DSM 10691 TaxID=1434326 RepID=A0A2K1PGC9_9BACT|nr:hypothetical protein X928_01975 [Petrotoga miotherma DSM 10691]
MGGDQAKGIKISFSLWAGCEAKEQYLNSSSRLGSRVKGLKYPFLMGGKRGEGALK